MCKIHFKTFRTGGKHIFFYTYFTIKDKLYHIKSPTRGKAETAKTNLFVGSLFRVTTCDTTGWSHDPLFPGDLGSSAC